MLKVRSILVTRSGLALCVVALLGCGQKGNLVQPTGEASQGRATLIESLTPDALRQRKIPAPTSPITPTPASRVDPLSPPPVAR